MDKSTKKLTEEIKKLLRFNVGTVLTRNINNDLTVAKLADKITDHLVKQGFIDDALTSPQKELYDAAKDVLELACSSAQCPTFNQVVAKYRATCEKIINTLIG